MNEQTSTMELEEGDSVITPAGEEIPMARIRRVPRFEVEEERIYNPHQVFLPVVPEDNNALRLFPLTRTGYLVDPETGKLTRLGKPMNKHQRRKAGVK